jgi:hypothetical protein
MVLYLKRMFLSVEMSTAKLPKLSSFLMFCFAGSTLFATSPAKAVNCMDDIGTIQDLVNMGGSCELRGVLLTYIPTTTGFALSNPITISAVPPGVGTEPATDLSISLQAATPYTSPFSGVFKYNLTAPTGKYITEYTSAIASSENGGNNSATFNLTGAAGTAMATYTPVSVAVGQTKFNSNYITSDNLTSQVSVTQGGITQFNASYKFQDIPPAPGPLPLAGLGIALGYSRKLRKRIAAS